MNEEQEEPKLMTSKDYHYESFARRLYKEGKTMIL